MPLMIWLAAIVEAAIENYVDMSILLFIQFANASIGYYEITKAGDAVTYAHCPFRDAHPDLPSCLVFSSLSQVAALKKSLKPTATVKRNGVWKNVDAAILVPG